MKKRKRVTAAVLAAVILSGLVSAVVFVEYRMKYVREELSAFTAQNCAASAILNGVEETIKGFEMIYSDIVSIERDDNNTVKSVVTDTAKLNAVSNSANRNVDRRINKVESFPVDFPLSALFSDEFFAGLGPRVRFYVTLTGTASTHFENEFEAAGINQTLHRIVLIIEVNTYVIFGGKVKNYSVTNEFCVAENIIVGITPDAVAQITK
ncbi:MAG: sporulation protein YunB [Clostridia bacterium]|nr:sporulation protein YunB [Clostridia bacterium]